MSRQTNQLRFTADHEPSASSQFLLVPKAAASYTLAWWGTMGGGTVTPKYSPDGGTTWISFYTDLTFGTAVSSTIPNGVTVFGGMMVTLDVSGATNPDIKAALI